MTVAAYAGRGKDAYHFLIASHSTDAPAALAALFDSFRILSQEEALAQRAREIEVISVGPRDSLQSLARQMASEHPLDHFLMLNARSTDQPLMPRERVKIVIYSTE